MKEDKIHFKQTHKNTNPPKLIQDRECTYAIFSPEDIVIWPKSERAVPLGIAVDLPLGRGAYITWKYREKQAAILLETSKKKLFVNMVNPGNKRINIKKNEKIAEISPTILFGS